MVVYIKLTVDPKLPMPAGVAFGDWVLKAGMLNVVWCMLAAAACSPEFPGW